MADYAIGDVQGCYDPLQRLLDALDFNDREDRLWFVGDLVNRGPQSLAVLRFVHALPVPAHITLGNHDLHLLARLFGNRPFNPAEDNLQDIVLADDAEELGQWLRRQPLLHYSDTVHTVMCHAGIAPLWDLPKAMALADELHTVLSGDGFEDFLMHMYGNTPDLWSDAAEGMDRLRLITNYFTRMRFCDAAGRLDLDCKGPVSEAPAHLYPWYAVPGRHPIPVDIVFGHWAALKGQRDAAPQIPPGIYPLDYGCLWGGTLAALRLQDKQLFSVPCTS